MSAHYIHAILHSLYIAVGILKGYDQLLNLVLDGTVEYLQGTCMPLRPIHTGICNIYKRANFCVVGSNLYIMHVYASNDVT